MIPFDWDDAFGKVAAQLAGLRTAEVQAGTATTRQSYAEQARRVERDLEALESLLERKKKFETSVELRKILPLFNDEARLLVASAFEPDESLRFGYAEKIREIRARREGQERRFFVDVVMRLDYRSQEDTFARLIGARRADRIATTLVCGEPDHGLYWVCNRLRRQIPPSEEQPFVLQYSFGSGAVKHDVSGIYADLARKHGLPRGAERQRIFEKVCDRWKTTNLVFLFSHVEKLGAPGLTALLEELWAPFAQEAARRRPSAASTWIAAFFLHHGDPSEIAAAPLCRDTPGKTAAHVPFLLPKLAPFDTSARERWQSDHRLDFPESIQDDTALAGVFDDCAGVPVDVLSALCQHWDYDFNVLCDLWERT